jgi:hypothetical protein
MAIGCLRRFWVLRLLFVGVDGDLRSPNSLRVFVVVRSPRPLAALALRSLRWPNSTRPLVVLRSSRLRFFIAGLPNLLAPVPLVLAFLLAPPRLELS